MSAIAIVRLAHTAGPVWAVERDGALCELPRPLGELLALPADEARAVVEGATTPLDVDADPSLLAPVDEQEVWASGVTYEQSRDGRMLEAVDASPYDRVYDAERPELFFKATAWRVVPDGEPVGIRSDSTWDVPEAELALWVHADGSIFGYGIGNDMSSRSIEGENPLYLPQAKVYDRSCSLAARIVPAWTVDVADRTIRMRVVGDDGAERFAGETSTARLHRTPASLASRLVSGLSFPSGAVLLTGTGIVPHEDFTLREGDVVEIAIDGIGTLTNPVVEVRA